MTDRRNAKAVLAAAISALALGASVTEAVAQPYGAPPPPPGQDYGQPPPADYGPPPGEGPNYDPQAYQADQQYAAQYQAWAARYCVQERNHNAAAGAVIGGAFGAILGGAIGGHAGGAIAGGVLGASAGAAVGANSGESGNCPPGYVITAGAPGFYWGGPPVYVPAGYNPWVFEGGRYVYVPYRAYYWHRHGWRGERHY
jgi:hypothetical protein